MLDEKKPKMTYGELVSRIPERNVRLMSSPTGQVWVESFQTHPVREETKLDVI